ncbi:MAG: single-stranded-DNA-specific exonuclease RecJ, partial [Oscillospiraceae bacterium]|nr:single-stranded-DNA-specific exonuclease RecJ [Oscillospiraceae bacterium]
LESMKENPRVGLAALMKESGIAQEAISASAIGFTLAPRINAAGRMGKIEVAIELFLTQDPGKAQQLAAVLCDLNRQRQTVESEIYNQAVSMLPQGQPPEAIVLAEESWHQGVVGIVASRMAEEYCCPTFLICLDGDHGKASSRSFGGFNLFSSLTSLSHLLESYGGHELAAGFTISRSQIPNFREQISQLAAQYYSAGAPRTVLDIDCAVSPELLTVKGVDALSALEPCGNGCPKPVLMMEKLTVERINVVGNGRHMRLRLRHKNHCFHAICFSSTPETASIAPGDVVDVAFHPQINEFRGERSVQMNVLDIRPSCCVDCPPDSARYMQLRSGTLCSADATVLLPERSLLSLVWRYLAAAGGVIHESPMCLCRKIVRWSGISMSLEQMLVCLDIFRDVGLLNLQRLHKFLKIELTPGQEKADLTESKTMQLLLRAKES